MPLLVPEFANVTVPEALTTPPRLMVSVPLPLEPTCKVALLVQVEPAPSTVTVPLLPLAKLLPMVPFVLLTAPPLVMVSVPVLASPTSRLPLLVQVEPAPSTVAVPLVPIATASQPTLLFTTPPLLMLSAPVLR